MGALVLGGASASADITVGTLNYRIITEPSSDNDNIGTAEVSYCTQNDGVLNIPEYIENDNPDGTGGTVKAKYKVVSINGGVLTGKGFSELTVPNTVTNLGSPFVMVCANLKKLTIGTGVSVIPANGIGMCSSLTDIVLLNTTPPTCTANSFLNLTFDNITLHVPAGAKAAYEAAEGWKQFKIEEIKGEDPKPAKLKVGDTFDYQDFTWTVKTAGTDTENGTVELTKALKPETTGTLTIPEVAEYTPENATEVLEKFTVVSIKGAALGQTHYTEIIVPNTVTKLQNLVVNDPYIQKVTLGSGLKEVGFTTISSCQNLTDITILATVPPTANAMAFLNLDVTKVILHVPAGTKAAYAAADVWKDFTNIEEPKADIEIVPEGTTFNVDGLNYMVTKTIRATGVGEVMFNGADAQDGVVVIPDEVVYKENKFNITDINGMVFFRKAYTEITLPNTMTTLKQQCIYNCSKLTKLTLGSGFTNLETNSIAYCSALTSLTCLATVPPTATASTFNRITYDNVTLTVPAGSEDAYKAAEGWKLFTKYTSGVEDINTENNAEEVYYNLQGVKVVNPVEGQVYICVKGNKATKVVY